MKLVLSGEDHHKRAQREAQVLRTLQEEGKRVLRSDLNKVDPEQLLTEWGTVSMFSEPKVIGLSGFEKLRSPKTQAALIQTLADSPDDVVISIAKDLTPGMKKLFDPKIWKLEAFAVPKSVFALCDALKTRPYPVVHQLFRQVIADESEWWLNSQLARTLHALLLVKAGSDPLGAPFQVQKWKKQAGQFTLEQIRQMLDGLYQIERRIKTGQTRLSWGAQFDILLRALYDEPHSRKGRGHD